MSADKLEQLDALVKAATPGPWKVADPSTYPEEEGGKILGPPSENSYGHRVQYYTAQYVTEPNAALIVWLVNNAPAILKAQAEEIARLREALGDLLAGCVEEYGEPNDGGADESVGWNGDGTLISFTYGLMQRARAALGSPPDA